MILTGRHLFRIIFVLLFSASPLLAGEANSYQHPRDAKYSADDNSFRHKSHGASCRLRIDENFEYYDIEGTTIAELKQQMRQGGTKWDDGKVYAALTTWDIRYNYEITEKAGTYSIKSVATDISVVFHLPNRIAVAAAPELLAGQWETYMENLMEHEYGHKDISVKAAAEINQTLASLESFSSKEKLDNEAKRLVAAKFKRLKELHIAYDEETRHGIMQGAILVASDPVQASLLPR
jgi:predicted secreted Zn-dependent protease